MTGCGGVVGPRVAPDWLGGRRRWWIGRRHVAILTCSYRPTFTGMTRFCLDVWPGAYLWAPEDPNSC